jgi:hypothetical protein
MANIIKPKRTNTAGNTPTTANLASGEFGVNMADQKTYINNGTAVVQVGAGNLTGLGDVNITSPTNLQALVYNASTSKWVNGTGGGGGSVSSVAATVPSLLTVTGSPITSSGTLAFSYSGTALPVANGGTGLTTTPANGTLNIGNGTGFTQSTLTAGANITITNAAGSITIASAGGSAATPITQNLDQVTANQTIASGSNGFSVGPITVASGYSVTVASGQRWVII